MQLFTTWLAAQAQGTRVKTIERSKARSKSPGRDEVELTPIGGQRFSVGVPTIPNLRDGRSLHRTIQQIRARR